MIIFVAFRLQENILEMLMFILVEIKRAKPKILCQNVIKSFDPLKMGECERHTYTISCINPFTYCYVCFRLFPHACRY